MWRAELFSVFPRPVPPYKKSLCCQCNGLLLATFVLLFVVWSCTVFTQIWPQLLNVLMTLFYPVENRKRKQKTIDVVRTFPPQILIHNTSRLTYLDNSQDHLSLPRMKLGLITLFLDASSPTPIVNNNITRKISEQLYLKSIRSYLLHSWNSILLQWHFLWVLLVSSSFRNNEVVLPNEHCIHSDPSALASWLASQCPYSEQ